MTLDGSSSFDPACGRIARYQWFRGDVAGGDIGDARPFAVGAKATVTLPTGADFTDHTFTLRVLDEQGLESRAPITIRASRNRPPAVEVRLQPEPFYQAGELFLTLVDLDQKGFVRLPLGGACWDPEHAIASCGWSASPGITIADPGSPYTTAKIPVQAYSLGSRRTIQLTAIDDRGYRAVVEINVNAFPGSHAISVGSVAPAAAAAAGVEQQVSVTVVNSGNYGELVDVTLGDESGGQISPLTQAVSIPAGRRTTVTFAWTPIRSGPHVLVARAGQVPGESNTVDNVMRITVDVAPSG